jgi:hypothetical protein
MKPTRIAAWSRMLTVGVISAIAITGMQSWMLASPRRSLDTTTQISDKNWQNHPKIVAIRKIVDSGKAEVRNGTYKTEHRICDEGWFSRDFESAATQMELSGGTSIIKKAKIHPGTIITTTMMLVDCDSF